MADISRRSRDCFSRRSSLASIVIEFPRRVDPRSSAMISRVRLSSVSSGWNTPSSRSPRVSFASRSDKITRETCLLICNIGRTQRTLDARRGPRSRNRSEIDSSSRMDSLGEKLKSVDLTSDCTPFPCIALVTSHASGAFDPFTETPVHAARVAD